MPSPFEDSKLQFARINQLAILVGIVFLVLLGRLWYLQIAMGNELLKQSESNRMKLLRTRAPRGAILDRKGKVLATSRPQFVVMANPDDLRKNPEALHTLCGILQITPDDLNAIFDESEARPGSPVRVGVVEMDTVARIGELRMRLPGVSVELDQIRYYPDGPAVAHIMGKLGEIDRDHLKADENAGDASMGYRPGDYIGKSGLEAEYEKYLKGTDGGKKIEVNAMGRVVRIMGQKESVPGKTIRLSIDSDLQVAGARALGNQVGAVVAVDPRSGAILAMVSTPAYDANVFARKVKPAEWRNINDNPSKPQQNRCVNGTYPPGSTFKPITATAGLIYGKTDFTTTCNKGARVAGKWFGCWERHSGLVDFNRAIAQSCDVYFYKLGVSIGIDNLAKIAKEFGIGSKTGIDLPSEARGVMPDTAWKQKTFRRPEDKKWWPGETPSVSIGQGAVTVTPLQMAMAIAGIANGGKIYQPRLMSEIVEPDENGKVIVRSEAKVVREVMASPEAFEKVRQAMRLTVTQGTGRVANMPDIAVAGKTGSAENYSHGKPMPAHAWFECFAPLEKPEIVVVCIVEHGRHGASFAAPVCRAILDVYFGKKKPSDIGTGAVHASGD